MGKRVRETDLSGASSFAPKPTERELAVILMTRFGVIKIALPRSDGEKCVMVKKELPFASMRLHRWEETGKLFLVGGEIDYFICPEPIVEVYELKVGGNLEIEILKSESIKPLNFGKVFPFIQSFGGKLFVLHSNDSIFGCPEIFVYQHEGCPSNLPANESAFEVFERDHWRFLPVPFRKLLEKNQPWEVFFIESSVRVPDKWYIIASTYGETVKSFVFDFIKEEWDEDTTVLSQFAQMGLPYPDGEYFRVPGFDENEYTILLAPKMVPGELQPHLMAYLLDKHQKLVCLQVIYGKIFGELFPPYKDPNPQSSSSAFFMRLDQSRVAGICYGWKSELAKLKPFLFLSIFSLERHPDFRLPLSDRGGVLEKKFLRVTRIKKHKVHNVPEPVGRFVIFGGSFTYL